MQTQQLGNTLFFFMCLEMEVLQAGPLLTLVAPNLGPLVPLGAPSLGPFGTLGGPYGPLFGWGPWGFSPISPYDNPALSIPVTGGGPIYIQVPPGRTSYVLSKTRRPDRVEKYCN